MAEARAKKVEEYYKNKLNGVEILVDNVWDPHNVAALSRTADGLGIFKINLYYTHNKFPDVEKSENGITFRAPQNPKRQGFFSFEKVGKKSSSSANKWIKYEQILDLKKFASEKKKEGFVFVGADLNDKSLRLDNFAFPEKVILVFGAESEGISEEVRQICDKFVFIPMVGMVGSYNISVAAGIFMYELFRQKGKGLKLRQN
jgi:tRNA (guanosine-2'-O-)-methyltransferase